MEYDDNDNVLPLSDPVLEVTEAHLYDNMTLANVIAGSYNDDYKRPKLSGDCKFICGMVQSEICGVSAPPKSFWKAAKWIIPHANDVSTIYGCEVWYSATGIFFITFILQLSSPHYSLQRRKLYGLSVQSFKRLA